MYLYVSFMYLCERVYVYLYINIYTYKQIYKHPYCKGGGIIYMYTYNYIYIHTHIYIYSCVYVFIYVYICECVCVCVCVRVCVCVCDMHSRSLFVTYFVNERKVIEFWCTIHSATAVASSIDTYRVADHEGEGPHASVGQGRIEAVLAKVLAEDGLHVDGQLGQKKVEHPVICEIGHQGPMS
jgi:hypothetical protein